MTFSDSLPVQFWIPGEETFNETIICGLSRQDCFCQPFNCDDDIIIQFQNSVGGVLIAEDEDGNEYGPEPFTESPTGTWTATFTPENNALCGESPTPSRRKIQLKVYQNASTLLAPSSWSDYPAWPPIEVFATKTATTFTVNADASNKLYAAFQPVSMTVGTVPNDIQVSASFDAGLTGNALVSILFYDSNGSVVGGEGIETAFGLGAFSFNETFSFSALTGNAATMRFSIDYGYGAGNTVATSAQVLTIGMELSDRVLVAFSDCLEISNPDLDGNNCTVGITYSNSNDFDGIAYSQQQSPDVEFFIRIPAMFFEENNPQEQEDIEKSNGEIITLRSTIQQKRLLEIGYMPPYMHLKLQKILMHDTIFIDGTYWRKRDSYEPDPIKKYNLKQAKVLLTKYNSVEKNTI